MATEKQLYHFTAEVKDVEIRRIEEVTETFPSKDGKTTIESHYIKLTCDVGEEMDRVFFRDKDMSNLNKYEKGMKGTCSVRIDVEEGFGRKATILVIDFKESK